MRGRGGGGTHEQGHRPAKPLLEPFSSRHNNKLPLLLLHPLGRSKQQAEHHVLSQLCPISLQSAVLCYASICIALLWFNLLHSLCYASICCICAATLQLALPRPLYASTCIASAMLPSAPLCSALKRHCSCHASIWVALVFFNEVSTLFSALQISFSLL